jgi:ell wall binding domain 2 (CWB2)
MPPCGKRLSALLAAAALAVGCGKTAAPPPAPFASAGSPGRGTIALATKNTTRLGGADPATDAAAVARAVYPGLTAATRPQVVVVVDDRRWGTALAASALAGVPLGAPLLYADGDRLPQATLQALRSMRPLGSAALGGAQVLRVGTVAPLDGYRVRTLAPSGDPTLAGAQVTALLATVRAKRPHEVIALCAGESPAMQMPIAGLSAQSGAPIVFVSPAGVPAATAAALRRLHHPTVYVPDACAASSHTKSALAPLGRVVALAGGEEGESGESGAPAGSRAAAPSRGKDPVATAVEIARFSDGAFGWGIHEPGHGLVFANSSRAFDAPAAAPLSAHGDYAPLLLVGDGSSVPSALGRYLSNIEPGYTAAIGPVRGVYNHGWLIGDERAISLLAQSEIDAILEVAPRTPGASEQALASPE